MDIIFKCIGFCLLFSSVRGEEPEPIKYNIKEEMAENTVIGNVAVDAGLSNKYSASVMSQLSYKFLSSDEDLFAIEENTGIIVTLVPIDRDVLCPGMRTCKKDMNIGVWPSQYFATIPVTVEILDQNDNSPKFAESEVSTSISEAAPVGTTITLPVPEDPDSPDNGLLNYEVLPPTTVFRVQDQISLDGEVDLQLILEEKLDRETKDFYQMRVVAYDAGDPVRSGSVLVNITVEDANDNQPQFTNSTYIVYVPENLGANAPVVTVEAHDADITHNGEVTYGFSRRTTSNYGHLFGIVAETGDVYVKDVLDAEDVTVYHLVVTAQDKGSQVKVAHASVTVHVQDMNDNPPQITVTTDSGNGKGELLETASLGTFVAHISVDDQDKGDSGRVTCSVNDTNFDIQQLPLSQYKIVTNNMFDREEQDRYFLMVTCQDHGSPSLKGIYNLTVNVKDVNDQTPEFEQSTYTASIQENNMADASIVQVIAMDKDIGENAEIHYSLTAESGGFFKIVEDTGVIRVARNLDYEEIKIIEFRVIATDQGIPPRSSTATVIVYVEDRNDNAPIFIQESYSFGIYENKPPGSDVGKVNSYDPDSEDFSEVHYALYSDAQYITNTFYIEPKTGQIVTKMQLDRESIDVYELEVLAFNPGFDMTSTASIIIYVADTNDNAPIIDFPKAPNDTVRISSHVPFGHVVTRVHAHDEDIGENSQLLYALIQGNEDGLFDMDELTGALTVTTPLVNAPNNIYNLSVEVVDSGATSLAAIEKLYIVLDGTILFESHDTQNPPEEEVSSSNSLIVIGVGCASGAIIVALVIAILAIRLQDSRRKKDRRYNCRMEAQKMLHIAPGTIDGLSTPSDKELSVGGTPNMYHPSTKYSVAGGDVVKSSPVHTGDNNIQMGSTVPEVISSRTSSFNDSGSLSKKFLLDRGRSPQHWSTQSPRHSPTAPCQASHGQHPPISSQHPLQTFNMPQTEVGHHRVFPNTHESLRHGDHQMPIVSHGFPAHTAAVNKQHLSPLAEDIQMNPVSWGGRPAHVDHDNESACSGEMSNTDSGRGASEEGEHANNGHSHGQPENRLSDISDSDLQEKLHKVGCHGNTFASMESELCPHGHRKKEKRWQKPAIKVLDAPSQKTPHHDGASTNLDEPIGQLNLPANASAHRRQQASDGTPLPLPPRQKLPYHPGPGHKKPAACPPRPPRTDSLRKDNPTSHRSFAPVTGGSQYGSSSEIADDRSSTTSGSYVVDHDDLASDLEEAAAANVANVTMRASNV